MGIGFGDRSVDYHAAPSNGSGFFVAIIDHRSGPVRFGSIRSWGRSGPVMGHGAWADGRMGHGAWADGAWADGRMGGWAVMPGKKAGDAGPTPAPPFFSLSIYIAPHEIFWPFWLKNKVLTSDNKAVRNSGMTLNYL